MRQLPGAIRPWVYFLAGALVGFLFLGEFALGTLVPAQLALLVLAVAGCFGVARRWRSLELWPAFVAAAEVVPLMIAIQIIGLPRCETVEPAVHCLASSRDVVTPSVIGAVAFVAAIAGATLFIVRDLAGWGARR